MGADRGDTVKLVEIIDTIKAIKESKQNAVLVFHKGQCDKIFFEEKK